MGSFVIEGGRKLKGEIIPQGAKNEALQVICACLLTKQKVILRNLPDIVDVNNLIALLKEMGVKVSQLSQGAFTFQSDNINLDYLHSDQFQERSSRLRGSVMTAGPLLARFKKAFVPKPGGDKIGRRRLDTHFLGMEKLGARFEYDVEKSFYSISAKSLIGTHILMDEASVTGTANIIMTAVLATGTTTVYNAACEPYIQQLCKMLIKMGASIRGVGSNLLTIEGVEELKGCDHTLLPDMIEIGSFIALAAVTDSQITIKNVCYSELGIIPAVFKKLGIHMHVDNDDITVHPQEEQVVETFIDGSILTVSDAPWPGFTPDLLSVVLVASIHAKGSVLIHQKMFESRLFFVDKLIDMGAQIILCDPHRATVIGLNKQYPLRALQMTSPDIRAGVALLIAALSARGTSTIHNIEQIDRGYQFIDKRLNAVGANIQRM
ncbi:MAG: UDP-N-acetylglucosamine 1-carboxyvinyltransferase [Bacteroidales bacterium]